MQNITEQHKEQPETIPSAIPLFDGDSSRPVSLIGQPWFDEAINSLGLDFDWRPEYILACDFLRQLVTKQNTFRTYRKEVERLFLWMWFVEKSSVFNLKSSAVVNYIIFQDSPPPHWVGGRCKYRIIVSSDIKKDVGNRGANYYIEGVHSDWRPFVLEKRKAQTISSGISTRSSKSDNDGDANTILSAPLSSSSKVATFGGLSALYSHYIESEACEHNPFRSARRRNLGTVSHKHSVTERTMSDQQLKYILEAARAHDDSFVGARQRFIVMMLYYLGLRISEVCDKKTISGFYPSTMGRIKLIPIDGGSSEWVFHVTSDIGKGGKERHVPMPPPLLKEVALFRKELSVALGIMLPSMPQKGEMIPLIPCSKPSAVSNQNLSDTAIRQDIKMLMSSARELMLNSASDAETNGDYAASECLRAEADALLQVSPHWFRHKFASDDLKDTGNISITQNNLGHSNIATTSVYVHTGMSDRINAAKNKVEK
ncbi:TPA: site-specific integrase [Aeromonas veronii]|nr:site-specific integrase [Aeromonas veronii]